MTQPPILTPEQRTQFLSQGYVKISNGMPPESVSQFMDNVWARLGWEENDKSTWNEETVHLPRHREIKHQEFMPRVYQAACELVGGEDRLDPELFTTSGDALIVNSGDDHWATHTEHPRDSGNWHIDGDWFTHYLDSSDQALVVICLFTDVEHGGGPTLICPAALPAVTRYMHDHPGEEFDGRKVFGEALKGIEDYVELTGKAGDVYLAHPFMPHSKSRNGKRNFRVITNPPFTLKEPFNYDRKDGNYSLLEQHTLNSLNVDSLPGWHITAPRARFPPRTQPGKTAKIEAELRRMQAHAEKTGVAVDSMHLRGEVLEQAKLDRYPAREAVNAAA